MPGRNRVPSFQLASGTTDERDGSYNFTTLGSIFYNTDTSNVEVYHEDPSNNVKWRDLVMNNKEQIDISGSLKKTRAQMIIRESGSAGLYGLSFVTFVSYGQTWKAYSSDPLYSISITGDYVDVERAVNYRIAVKNQSTNVTSYFPSTGGWIKHHYTSHTRLDGHVYHGIMSNLTHGDTYKTQLEVKPNKATAYNWNSNYGTITGIVWD